ncbi:zf-HC2 domain-containing protein [Nakamurella silvestris]|nr:zf-HC2 domain-containing protein [Nakamurella silvestris]
MSPDCFELAAYLLCALEPADSLDFERHLQDCDRCTEELGELSTVVPHLYRAWPEPALREPARPVRGPRPTALMLPPRAGVHLSRRHLLTGLGLVAATGAVIAFSDPTGRSDPTGPVAAAPGPGPAPDPTVDRTATGEVEPTVDRVFPGTGGNTIRVRLARADGGSILRVDCSIVAVGAAAGPPKTVSLWCGTSAGEDLLAATWLSVPSEVTMSMPFPVPVASLCRLQLRDVGGSVLSTVTV